MNKDLLKRLREEQKELITKIKKANSFRASMYWKFLDVKDSCLLDAQIKIMEAYLDVLTDRIILLKNKEFEKTSENELDRDFDKMIDNLINNKELDKEISKFINKIFGEGEK